MTSTLSSDHAPSTKDAPADRDGLLQAAQRLGPLICEHAAAAERNRRLSPEVIRALTDRGFFRLLTPRSLGGLEVDPITCSLVAETLAGFDSAAGWALAAARAGGRADDARPRRGDAAGGTPALLRHARASVAADGGRHAAHDPGQG